MTSFGGVDRGVYWTANLGTSSHISSLSLHLISFVGGGGGILDSQSGYFISHLIFVTLSDKFCGGISEHFSEDLT